MKIQEQKTKYIKVDVGDLLSIETILPNPEDGSFPWGPSKFIHNLNQQTNNLSGVSHIFVCGVEVEGKKFKGLVVSKTEILLFPSDFISGWVSSAKWPLKLCENVMVIQKGNSQ